MNIRGLYLLCVILLLPNLNYGQLQDCTLGLGNKDTDVIFKVFKLSEEQQALAEAMAAGTPVVAVDAAGAHEIVHPCVNGFLLQKQNQEL